MPHIKSIRLVNVQFNNATQFFDDFYLEPAGRNTTYDLENGGGKSLLLMMLLQVVLPKTYLRKEKPLSLLFQGGKDRTSHVAVEWILEEGHDYKYLLTGFSARKRRGLNKAADTDSEEEEGLQSADIEHRNWLVFYNDHRFTGCRTAPLARHEGGSKRYAGFDGIRRYIQQMQQKGLPAEIFDRIDQYQHYVAAHHLLAAEWNIIRGINSGENNIESYFRQNATSRKLIENLFVKIVEDVEALDRGGRDRDESLLLADTLIEIRVRLNDYLRLKSHLHEFTAIKAYYSEFAGRNRELLAAFQQFEAGKRQAAAIYNLIGRKRQTLEQEMAEIRARLAEHKTGSEQAGQLEKLLAAGLVNLKKENLQAEERQLSDIKKQLTARQGELEKELNHLLALEEYGEYRAAKEKVFALNRSLESLAAGADSLQDQYNEAGGLLRFLLDRRLAEFELSLAEAQRAKIGLEEQWDLAREDLSAAESNAAVLKAAIGGLDRQVTALTEKAQELSGIFLQAGDLDAALSPDAYAERLQGQFHGCRAETAALTGRLDMLEAELQDAGLESVCVKNEIDRRCAARERVEARLAACRQERAALENKARAWEREGIEAYRDALQQALRRESLHKLEMEIETGRERRKKQLSADNGFYVPNEEIFALAGQLQAKCPFVQAGVEWIDKAEALEREGILRAAPYLPFSVIVDGDSFARLRDGRIKPGFASDYPVPLVNLESLRGEPGNSPGGADGPFYLCSFAGLLLDRGEYERYIRGIEEKIRARDRDISAMETRIGELDNDLAEVALFINKYPQAVVAQWEKEVADLAEEVEHWQGRRREVAKGQERLKKEREGCRGRLKELAGLTAMYQEKIERFAEKRQTEFELTGIREQLQAKKRQKADVAGAVAGLVVAVAELKRKYREEEGRLAGLREEGFAVKQEAEQAAGFAAIENDLPLARARASFKALREAVGGRIAEESDLRSSLLENKERLARLQAKTLRDYGEDLAEIEKGELAGVVVIVPAQNQIVEAGQAKEANARRLAEAGQSIGVISRQINTLEGRLEEILKDFTADQQSKMPRYEDENRYRQEISEVGQLLKSYERKISGANVELDGKEEENRVLGYQQENYRAFLDRESVDNDGELAAALRDFRQFENEYLRRRDAIRGLYSKWDERLRSIQAETAAYVIREPLEELGKITLPVSAAQCLDRKMAFHEYLANIEEQMQKITDDISRLESYQEDFTRRCAQRAELALGHIKKLEALSRIEVYGRRTNMIELRLQEFEEKDKQMRMKEHINGIIREISEEGQVDRKRVATRLSTKELLARIVDMDKAVVRLYKVEGIPENSRFYRWEHAIGSEGQNNSLYFIFAACLISFIRMLSITNSSARTRKVIIADNPFGATSAVYLWEPMFKILRQNDIQLIAPGHRIPREITSRFAVSYLLNQDILQDGRRRVVVKDVRGEEDEEVLLYIEPEQMSIRSGDGSPI